MALRGISANRLPSTINATTMGGALDLGSTGQLVFPATQNASAGANTLDDYEEGTSTPSLSFGGASVGITYNTRDGSYTKLGQLVSNFSHITLSSKGSSTGTALISLPFTSGASSTWFGGIGSYYGSFSGVSAGLTTMCTSGSASFDVGINAASTSFAADTNFANGSDLYSALNFRASA